MKPLCPAAGALLAALALAAPPALRAQSELVTDRPDRTESAEIVPPGSVQIETGVAFSRDDEAGLETEATEVAASLLRIGLRERLELRVGWGGLIEEKSRTRVSQSEVSGSADLDLGVKLRLVDEAGSRPALALVASASMPVGADAVSSDRVDPSVLLSAAHGLSDCAGLGYNVGAVWETVEDVQGGHETVYSWVYSLAGGFSLAPKWNAFVEVFGRVPGSSDEPSETSFDGGFTYLFRPNQQVDVFAGIGLSDSAPDWFVGLGFSIRLPE